MKIALFGYGKMGKIIEKIAEERGHKVVLKIQSDKTNYDIKQADIAIDFSVPSAAVANIKEALNNQLPVVCGTTGWLNHYDEVEKICRSKKGAFIYASNFSLGVNLFFELNQKLAKLMSAHPDYTAKIEEIHHTEKKDAPSGTAITLAEALIDRSSYLDWCLGKTNDSKQLSIQAKRIENVSGTHRVLYDSPIDSVEIIHTAKSRHGFGFGAVIAAEWLLGRTGVFSMKDVLKTNNSQQKKWL
ncbi:MAG: 4-hydroxy-tetrahydrodipicolinate reductase [Flavobacteriaceae bacterium]|nr:4-hydroxy-tetrahydrodipicolinate reductase [Flavobacteriaceae bacterium]|tara:strand:- start:3260 stop:3988 length:729 start_codon:yes stop_codon:yes gene_type:complete